MAVIEYYVDGVLMRLNFQTGEKLLEGARVVRGAKAKGTRASASIQRKLASEAVAALHAQEDRMQPLMAGSVSDESTMLALPKTPGGATVVATSTMIVEKATAAERRKLISEGLTILNEGEEGKLLLQGPSEGIAGVQEVAKLARESVERGNVQAAHPNFVRVLHHIEPSPAGNQPLWHQSNGGSPGIVGADVAAWAAWTITHGDPSTRVAILDEGVDTEHLALKSAVAQQADYVDGHPTAMPDGDDAHGTACAGIIFSRSEQYSGLANECSLVAVRIAKGDGRGNWIFDDFQTADAIDWSWKKASSDVLSCSWGGGPPSPSMTAAFQRAQTRGRGGKGCIIVAASGNANSRIDYPATIPFILAVGATTPYDVRQSPNAKGGERGWGSNFGRELDLVAPGVKIATTDIQGPAGYSEDDFTLTFNGTSSATPMVAAGAAMILSVRPELNETRVREILIQTTDRLTTSGRRNNQVGWGRLNLFAALRLARR